MSGSPSKPRTRVMLVDDHDGFRAAMRSALQDEEWIELTADAASGEQALQLLEAERPDVVLMDSSMPGMNGLEATREVVRQSDASVIGLSMHARESHAAEMREAGAKGWVTKGGDIDELVRTIERVAAGLSAWENEAPDGVDRDHGESAR